MDSHQLCSLPYQQRILVIALFLISSCSQRHTDPEQPKGPIISKTVVEVKNFQRRKGTKKKTPPRAIKIPTWIADKVQQGLTEEDRRDRTPGCLGRSFYYRSALETAVRHRWATKLRTVRQSSGRMTYGTTPNGRHVPPATVSDQGSGGGKSKEKDLSYIVRV